MNSENQFLKDPFLITTKAGDLEAELVLRYVAKLRKTSAAMQQLAKQDIKDTQNGTATTKDDYTNSVEGVLKVLDVFIQESKNKTKVQSTDFDFIVQEKYKIAKDRSGSGNTKNMGSCVKLSELKNGIGPFSKHGVKVFDDYWMNYLTSDMATLVGLAKSPYSNIQEYLAYRNIKNV